MPAAGVVGAVGGSSRKRRSRGMEGGELTGLRCRWRSTAHGHWGSAHDELNITAQSHAQTGGGVRPQSRTPSMTRCWMQDTFPLFRATLSSNHDIVLCAPPCRPRSVSGQLTERGQVRGQDYIYEASRDPIKNLKKAAAPPAARAPGSDAVLGALLHLRGARGAQSTPRTSTSSSITGEIRADEVSQTLTGNCLKMDRETL